MKKKASLVMAGSAIVSMLFVSSSYGATEFWEPLTYYNPATWQKADGYSNGGMFNCTWRANNVSFTSDGHLKLGLTSSAYNVFDCAEYRSVYKYGYGLYEVSMKPAKNTGIVSSFFTGPADGTPWDEIDIEFLGKDTTKVQFNYFTNGVGGHEKVVDLGFDASQGFHTYAFNWQAGSIKWYVDGVLKHTATSTIPTNPGKIMMNIWNGTGVDGWLGAYNGANPLYAEYDWMKYTSN
jgi:endo-1,3-1,4-beta-glycanase ExoK